MNFFMYSGCKSLAGDDSRSVTITFHLDNLFGSTNGLDPTDLKSGRVLTQGPGQNRRLSPRPHSDVRPFCPPTLDVLAPNK